jgi:hypothetical protein
MVLDGLDLHLSSWIVQHNKQPNKWDVTMGILEHLILLQLSKQTPHVSYWTSTPWIIPIIIANVNVACWDFFKIISLLSLVVFKFYER